MKAVKTVRVYVAAGEGVEDARRAVADVMEMLNRHFRPRGVEFIGAAEGEGDWTIALYWKDYGEMGREEFETVYEQFKSEKKPIIHVFFKEPEEGIAEALKVFKGAFEKRYGHFYDPYRTIDEVRFRVMSQGLWIIPGEGDRAGKLDMLKVEDGEVRLDGRSVAKLENLPFAKLNEVRKRLVRKIHETENAIAEQDKVLAEGDEDRDAEEVLATERKTLKELKGELARQEQYLFETAIMLSQDNVSEMGERYHRALELFNKGKVRAAREVLDIEMLLEKGDQCLEKMEQGRKEGIECIRGIAADAKLALSDEMLGDIQDRFNAACRNFEKSMLLAEKIGADDPIIADVMVAYALLLAEHNHFKRGEEVADAAARMYERLVAAKGDACLPDWANALVVLGNLHTDRNRFDVAEESYSRALEIWRRLSKEAEFFEHALVRTLCNLGALHGRREELELAEEKYTEALERISKMEGGTNAIDAEDMAVLLIGLANIDKERGQFDAAEQKYRWAFGIRQQASEKPPRIETKALARAERLSLQAGLCERRGHFREAQGKYEKSVEILQRLVAINPDSFEPVLAQELHGLAWQYQQRGQLAQAEKENEKAMAIWRRLLAKDEQAYLASMAYTLSNLANLHNARGQLDLSEQEQMEAISILRKLEEQDDGVYMAELAKALNNLASLHRIQGKLNEAQKDYEEVVEIQRKLVAKDKRVHEPILAGLLNNQANLHRILGKLDMAEQELSESVAILRGLVEKDAEAYERNFAIGMLNLAGLHVDQMYLEKAEKEFAEAAQIWRRLVAKEPGANEIALANMLINFGVLQTKMGLTEAAEKSYEEALGIWRHWVAIDAEAHMKGLAMVLHNLATLHSTVNRLEEASREYGEAVDLYRKLAETNHATYDPDVAMTLGNLALLAGKMGNMTCARLLALEALEIYNRCEERMPGQFMQKIAYVEEVLARISGQRELPLGVYEVEGWGTIPSEERAGAVITLQGGPDVHEEKMQWTQSIEDKEMKGPLRVGMGATVAWDGEGIETQQRRSSESEVGTRGNEVAVTGENVWWVLATLALGGLVLVWLFV